MTPDQMGFVPSNPEPEEGTTQWMSPELLDPGRFGLKDSRSTRESDCYALGMVVYEVLSGRSPFAQCGTGTVIMKVLDGERPARPQGVEGARFTDVLWEMLERCWKPRPHDRPSVEAVLECLEGRSSGPPIGDRNTDVQANDCSDPTTANTSGGDSRELPLFRTRPGDTEIMWGFLVLKRTS